MIPFSQLVQYGNEVKVNAIVDLQASANAVAVRYSDGSYYTRGSGSNYILGDGQSTTTVTSWYKVNYTVRLSAFGYSYQHVIITTDNRMLHVGLRQSTDGTATYRSTFGDISTKVTSAGLNVADITQIGCTQTSIHIVMSNGDYYALGNNTNSTMSLIGATGTSNYTTFQLITTGVTKLSTNITSVFIIKDSELYSCGFNTNAWGQLGTGSTSGTAILAARTVSGYTPLDVRSGYAHTVVLMQNNSTLDVEVFVCGRNTTNGSLGIGTVTASVVSTLAGPSTYTSLAVLTNKVQSVSNISDCALEGTLVLLQDGTLYAAGAVRCTGNTAVRSSYELISTFSALGKYGAALTSGSVVSSTTSNYYTGSATMDGTAHNSVYVQLQ